MITMLTLLCICAHVISGNAPSESTTVTGAQITSLGPNHPVYYDSIGQIQLIHDEWKLLVYFNLSTYWDGVRKIEDYIQHAGYVCKKIDPKYCEPTMQQLYHEQDLLNHYNYLLLSPHKHLSGRSKRGLVDGVGYVANSLFGILDQRFATKYEEDIKTIQLNENHLLELIKNQTSIIQLHNDILDKSEGNIKRQFTLINNYMNQTDWRLANVESEIEIVMAANYFTSTSVTTYLLLNNLKNIQDMIYNALVDVYQGHVDVHLLTPVNLVKQLTEISGKLPKTLALPIENMQSDIKTIYKLMYAKARVTGDYFLLEAHIPLTSNDDYSMYRVIPLPLRSVNATEDIISLQVSSDYIAVNFRKNTYVTMSEHEITHCLLTNGQRYICNLNLPLKSLESVDTPCEAKLLSHHSFSSCIMKKTTCKTNWIELHTSNSWLALCCDSCTIRSVCSDDIRTYVINTSSIVTLRQACVLQSKDQMILSRNSYNTDVKLDYDIKVPSLGTSINSIVSTPSSFKLEITENEDIKKAKTSLEQLKNNEQLPTPVTVHDIHQYILCYLLLAIAIVSITIWIAKRRGWCAQQAKINVDSNKQDIELQSIERREIRSKRLGTRSETRSQRGPIAAARGAGGRPSDESNCVTPADVKFEIDE